MTTQAAPLTARDLSWLVDSLVTDTDGLIAAAVISVDGLLVSASSAINGPAGDVIASAIAGLNSLVTGAADIFDSGATRQVMVRYDNGFLLLRPLGTAGILLGVVSHDASLSLISHAMTDLVTRVGSRLSPRLINQIRTTEKAAS